MWRRRLPAIGLIAGFSMPLLPALAQVEEPDDLPLVLGSDAPIELGTGVTTYVASFFLEANPANARDMINRRSIACRASASMAAIPPAASPAAPAMS
jgi:hypothetical protein